MQRSSLFVIAAAIVAVAGAVFVASAWLQPLSGRPAAAAPAPSSRLSQIPPFPPDASALRTGIVVMGEGAVTVQPDLARVTLGVEVTAPTAAGAQQDAAARMDAVMADLKKAGIPEKDIQTVRFDLSPDYDYSTRTAVLKGYRVTNLVVATVRDISKVGALLDAVVASGATRLQGISFGVGDPTAAGVQGREEAMKNARAKADQLARLGGVTLGPPIAIEESVSAPPVPMEMVREAAPAAAAPRTPISPGTQEIRTVVRVTYAIR